ncbi:uncharacterized protein LOC134254976 [Saccostrea cucullata]|uniref:uncharacterized protein LOC134254976 n=1 Tax=Saccostrea cuccullata TaxID=36930 RepID=UPI002ED09C21
MLEKNMNFDECISFSTEEMDCLLRKFYAETKRVNGEVYAKKSMISLRYGLQKHFLKTRKEDIINDEAYKTSNEMFKAVLVKLKKDGVGESKQKEPITPEDLSKLYDTEFSTETPTALQKKTIFEYIYYFCNRGRENIRELQKEDFTISTDSTGREYVTVRERQTKNHRGDDLMDTSVKQGRMYDRPGDPNCPVASFKKYLGKLHPNNPNFWQRAKRKFDESDETWYDNSPVGKNALYAFMANLSAEAKLSKRYTNHCIRATSISTLDHQGIEARHIMSVSGHKNETSIKSYSSKLSDQKKREMSDILGKNIHSSKTVSTVPSTCDPPTTNDARYPQLDFLECDIVKELLENDFSLDHVPCDSLPLNTSLTNTLSSNTNQFKFSNCNVTFNFTK